MIKTEAVLSKEDKQVVDTLALISILADSQAKKIIRRSLKNHLQEGPRHGKK